MDIGWSTEPAMLRCEAEGLSYGAGQAFGPVAYRTMARLRFWRG